jgi:hypothetical protein
MDIERTMEFILSRQADAEVAMARLREAHEKTEAVVASLGEERKKTEVTLRRAIRLGVQEARNERKRRQDMDKAWDEKITQLAAVQLVTEQKLQGFIDSLQRGGNGRS